MILRLLVCFLVNFASGARILGIFPYPSYSHQIIFQPIWKELSLRGHNVTVITPNPLKDPSLINLTEIDVGEDLYRLKKDDKWTKYFETMSFFEEIGEMVETAFKVSETLMNNSMVEELLKNSKGKKTYDLVLIEFAFLSLLHPVREIFNCSVVSISSFDPNALLRDAIGHVTHPGLDPNAVFLPFSTQLSFFERTLSVILNVGFGALISSTMKENRNSRNEPMDVSVVLVNSNVGIYNVKPLVPAYVEISGIHIQPPKPLPIDLQKFLDESKEGVIYVSFGSIAETKFMNQEKLGKMMDVFSKLPFGVLWKLDGTYPNLPENVQLRNWIPQQDVLRHPNIRLFVTHAGLLSVDEAIHFSVPLLAVPLFADHKYNSHHLVATGLGLSIDWVSFDQEEFGRKILEVITVPKYKDNVARMSKIVNDQPMPALEKAVWWIEYVLRHDGARHLRYPGLDMPFYQYYMLDVIAFITVVLALIFYILFKIFKRCVGFFTGFFRQAVDKKHSD